MEELNKAWSAASQDIYQAQQEAGANPEESTPTADNSEGESSTDNGDAEDVTDVEFEEVDDKTA